MMSDNNYILNFLEMLEIERGLAKNTIISYKNDLNQLNQFCIDKNINITKLNEVNLENYLSKFVNKGFEKTSLARKISSYTQFFDYLINEKLINNSPIKNIKQPKLENKLPALISVDDIQKLITNMQGSVPN